VSNEGPGIFYLKKKSRCSSLKFYAKRRDLVRTIVSPPMSTFDIVEQQCHTIPKTDNFHDDQLIVRVNLLYLANRPTPCPNPAPQYTSH